MKTKLNRRTFLKTSGAMVAPTIIPASALGYADKPAAGDRIALGLIGSGGKGRDLMTDFKRTSKEAQFVAVVDPDRTQAEKGKAVAEKRKKAIERQAAAANSPRPTGRPTASFGDFLVTPVRAS